MKRTYPAHHERRLIDGSSDLPLLFETILGGRAQGESIILLVEHGPVGRMLDERDLIFRGTEEVAGAVRWT